MGYNNSNNNQNINNNNNNYINKNYSSQKSIIINDEFKNIPLNNYDDIFQIKSNNNSNYNDIEEEFLSNKYSIILFRDLITNKFNDSLPLLLTTIIDNPIEYSNLINTINNLKMKSNSKLADSLYRGLLLIIFLITILISLLILLLVPFNIYYYSWLIIIVPLFLSIYYIDRLIKIKSIRKFMTEIENTHTILSNMNEWRIKNISFKSIFLKRDERGFLKKVNSSNSNDDIKDFHQFYQALIIEFPKNSLNQSTIFNLQIMDYNKILNNLNNQDYENFDNLQKEIKKQQQQQQQQPIIQNQEYAIDENDLDYNEHFIQNYYSFNNNPIINIDNNNNNTHYFCYHINE